MAVTTFYQPTPRLMPVPPSRPVHPRLSFGLPENAVYEVRSAPPAPVGAGDPGMRLELLQLCRLPIMPRLIELACRRQAVVTFERKLEAEYRARCPYADEMQVAREVYGDRRYEQMINRIKYADSAQCARMLAVRIVRDMPALAVRTAVVEGFGSEFVLVAPQLPDELTDWHDLPEDTLLMDPWGQRQGAARGLLTAAGVVTSELRIQRSFA